MNHCGPFGARPIGASGPRGGANCVRLDVLRQVRKVAFCTPSGLLHTLSGPRARALRAPLQWRICTEGVRARRRTLLCARDSLRGPLQLGHLIAPSFTCLCLRAATMPPHVNKDARSPPKTGIGLPLSLVRLITSRHLCISSRRRARRQSSRRRGQSCGS